MKKKELQAIAEAAAKNIKTEDDLNQFRQMLTKITVETARFSLSRGCFGRACTSHWCWVWEHSLVS
jgi:hypothetical protein